MKDIRHNMHCFGQKEVEFASTAHEIVTENIEAVYGPIDDHTIFNESGDDIWNIFFMKDGTVITTNADWKTTDGYTTYRTVEVFSEAVIITKEVVVWQ